jgi:hypothetical protein
MNNMMKSFLFLIVTIIFWSNSLFAQNRTYEYDELNRLAKAHYWDGAVKKFTVTYVYDEVGNRSSKTVTLNCTSPGATLSGTQTITEGQTANLSVTLTGTAPWTIVMNGTSYTANATPYNIPVNPSSSTTYNLSSVSNSCGSGTITGSAIVTVNPACVLPTATLTTANQTINLGQSVTLSIDLSGTPPISFVIDGMTYSGINPSPIVYTTLVAPTTTKTYTLTAVSNNCGTGTTSGSTTITVNVQSIAFTSPTGGTYSSGQNVPITYTSSNGTGSVNLELVSCTGTTSLGAVRTSTTASGSLNYAIPTSLPDGSYRIKAYTSSSPSNAYYSNCFNYYACGTLPDIIISDVSITKYAANRVNYAVTVKNTSISPASLGSVSLGVFASPDALRNNNDIFKSAIFVGGGILQPGQTYVINDFSSFNFADPNYYLGFSIDYHGLLTECYESNNDFVKLVNKCNASGTDIALGFLSDPFYAFNGTVIVPSTNQYTTPKMIVARAFKVNPTTNLTNLSLVVGNCLTMPAGARVSYQSDENQTVNNLGILVQESKGFKFNNLSKDLTKISLWDASNNELIKEYSIDQLGQLENNNLKRGKYIVRLESEKLFEAYVVEI